MQIQSAIKTKLFRVLLIVGILIGLMAPIITLKVSGLSAGTIDLEISSPTENFAPSETAFNMKPGDSVNREIEFLNKGTNPFNAYFGVEKISGDDDFCNALQLHYQIFHKSDLDVEPVIIDGFCDNLTECDNIFFGNNITPNTVKLALTFTLTLPHNVPASLQNKTCQFNFVFLAQQLLPHPCPGPECPEEEPNSTSTENVFNILLPNVALAYFSDTEIITNTVKSGQWVKPDFWIEKIDPVQVVWDSKINNDWKIDLVSGKPTMVRVYIGMKDYESLPKDLPVDVRLTFNVFDTKSKTVGDLEQSDWIDFYPIFLEGTGDYFVTAEVDPAKKIDESAEYNNSKLIIVTLKNTRGLYLINFPVEDYEGNKPNPSAYQKQITEGGEFILGTYPISPKKFRNPDSEEEFKTTEDLTENAGRIQALLRLWYSGGRATNWENDVAVGIVPEGSLGEGWHGVAPGKFLGFGAVFVEENYWTITAHEVGHVYGLWRWKEEYDIPERCQWIERAGYWVNQRMEINNALCFMVYPLAEFKGAIDWDSWLLENHLDTWIDNDCYKNLFWEFLTNPTDPEVLIVGGIISKNGSISLGPSYRVPNGRIDSKGESGDYSIKIFGINDEVIDEIPFDIRFQLHVTPGGIMETDIAPFGLSLPYTPDTSRVEISQNGQIIAEFNPNTKLLHDAVDLIPNSGFEKNPDQLRKALHNKIDAIEKIFAEGDFQGAIHKLDHDIQDNLEKWLVDNYQTETLLQYSKNEIIELVDKTIERLTIIDGQQNNTGKK